MNSYECWCVLDRNVKKRFEAENSFDARKQFRDWYNEDKNAYIGVFDCVARRIIDNN
jgi:hypothetical protein